MNMDIGHQSVVYVVMRGNLRTSHALCMCLFLWEVFGGWDTSSSTYVPKLYAIRGLI